MLSRIVACFSCFFCSCQKNATPKISAVLIFTSHDGRFGLVHIKLKYSEEHLLPLFKGMFGFILVLKKTDFRDSFLKTAF
jgi:TctA family transporter